jgi:uncharacterized protein (TIGR03437 family)
MKHCIFISFLVVFASILVAQPSIDPGAVYNVSSGQPTLAPNVVFVVYGKNLGPADIVVASPPNYPTTLANTSITFTPVGSGAAINALMYYTLSNAVTGVLPSSVQPGTYTVRVIYNGQTSNPQNVTVVAHHFGIATANGAGTGVAQATDNNVNGGFSLSRYTSSGVGGAGNFVNTPAHGGDSISLWGTGGGADLPNDTGGSLGDQTAAGNFKVMVGSRIITPVYTGAVAGFPGLWVVIYNLPADIDPTCYAQLQVSSNGELSNLVYLPIAAAGQSACFDPQLTPEVLSKLDLGGTITGGTFGVYRVVDTPTNTTVEGASGAIYRWTAAEWIAGGASRTRNVGCTVYDRTYLRTATDPANPDASLNAGATLPLSGPGLAAGAALTGISTATGPVYSLSAATGTLASGKYTLTSNGGTQVGGFTVSANFPASFTVTNFDSITAINRSQPLVINWTGSGVDQVFILVNSTSVVGTSNHIVTISCIAPAAPETFTVPVNLLSQLQPALSSGPNFGGISVEGTSNPNFFTATLVSGVALDFGVFGPNLGVSKNIAVQ